MEENKPKNSFFRKWAKRIALFLGITSSTLALGSNDAHAATLINDTQGGNAKVSTNVEHANVTNSNLKTDLDQRMAQDKATNFKTTVNSATNLANSVTSFSKNATNLRNSSSFTSALDNAVATYEAYKDASTKYNNMTNTPNAQTVTSQTKGSQILSNDAPLVTGETHNISVSPTTKQTQNITFKTTTIEYPSTEKVEKSEQTAPATEIEKETKTSETKEFATTSKTEQTQTMSFKTTTVEYPDTEKTENVSNVTSEKNNVAVMSDIEAKVKNLVAQSKFKNLQHSGYSNYGHYIVQLQEKIRNAQNNGDTEVAEQLKIRFEKEINKLTNLMDKKQNTVGKQIVSNASKSLELELAINSFIQHNTPDKFNKIEKENYYTILGKLMDAYNNLKLQNKDLAEQAHTDISNPEYNLEEATKFTKTTQANNATKEVATEPQTSSNTNKATTQQTTTFKTTEQVTTQEATAFNNTAQVSTQEATTFKTTTVDSHSVAPGTVDVSKLYTTDVSVGQMGIYDDEEKTATKTQTSKVNTEKLAEGVNQMGIWDEIEPVIDTELEKMEADKAKSNTQTKSKDDDDDYER